MRFTQFTLIFLSCIITANASQISSEEQALHLDWRDLTVSPAEDFYAYANGSWIKNNPIPNDHDKWSTFEVLQEENTNNLHLIMQTAANNSKDKNGSIEQKIGDFYTSGMDKKQRDRLGITPLLEEFKHIEDLSDLHNLPEELARLHLLGINAFFCFESMPDFKDSTQSIGSIVQSGLTLPDRDYYLLNNHLFKHIRTELTHHLQNMFQLLGESKSSALKDAMTVMRIETALARASMSQIDQRDPHAIYNITKIDQLNNPAFIWSKYINALGLKPIPVQINVAMPKFVHDLQVLLTDLPIDDVKTYLRWHLIHDSAAYLSTPFVDENFRIIAVLSGAKQHKPRWKQVVCVENQALGFAVGELYVQRYFSEKSKLEVLQIIHAIHQVLKNDLSTLAWMKPVTRQAALKKLHAMEVRVGYPAHPWSYDSLFIDRGPYVLNVMRANKFLMQHDLDKIGHTIDRSEWDMTPQTINAYYDPSMNSINLPSGILRAPFFDINAPEAVNYGGIGFVIGHEITHGFDDQGAKFDAQGNLHNWWTADDLKTFTAATQCISEQFSTYTVNSNLHVKGPLVVGEATADLGGLTLAYRAFKQSNQYDSAKTIHGLTPDQQFFLSAAHTWSSNIRAEKAAERITTDPHPPARFRVNGTLGNLNTFRKAFHLPALSPMMRQHQCKIW